MKSSENMSRHRNVRSMNYSEEYEGFDDVYGHSMEDDHCISPSDAGFIYDRSRYPQMSAFLHEDNYITEEDEESHVERKKCQKSDLSETEINKLKICMDEIQNVIGDMVPRSTIEEIAMSYNFDVKISLDHILNEAEIKKFSVVEESNLQVQKKSGNKFKGGGDDSGNSFQKFVIPKLKCAQIENIEQGVNDLRIQEGANDNYFSSLKMLMDIHKKESGINVQAKEVEQRELPSNPTTLAELSECFLNAKNPCDSQIQSINETKRTFIIPKLQNKDVDKSNNWIIDLSSALKTEIKSCSKESTSCTSVKNIDFSNLSAISLEDPCPTSDIYLAKISDVALDLYNRNSSPFGKILCKRWKCRMLDLQKPQKVITSRVIPFDFTTPSPDDLVLKFLRRK